MPQLGTCDQCGREVPRKDLVRKLRPYGYDCSGGGGVNRFGCSRYNADWWTCSATDAGCVSMGLYPEQFQTSISGTTVTETNGSQTWAGSGVLRTSRDIFFSEFSDVLFGVYVGAYHAQDEQSLTVTTGCCDETGAVIYTAHSFVVKGSKFCWWSDPLSVLLAAGVNSDTAFVYLDVVIEGTAKWWADGAIVCGATTPPLFQPTSSGSPMVFTGKGYSYLTPALCPKCVDERLLKPSEDKGKPRFAEPVAIRSQIESL
jgi:hypothetical protein